MMDLPSKLKEKNIYLRLIKLNDVKKHYVEWLNNIEVTKHTDQISHKHTIQSVKKYVNKINSSKNSFLYGIFFVNKSKKKIHIGNIKIGPIIKLHKSAYISYLIGDRRFWNKNVGTLLIKRIKKICKSRHKLKKISAGVSELNKASSRILLKNGFKLEGVFRKHIIFNNKRYNLLQYGISI